MKSHLVCVVPLVSLWVSGLATSTCAQGADSNHNVPVSQQPATKITIPRFLRALWCPSGYRQDRRRRLRRGAGPQWRDHLVEQGQRCGRDSKQQPGQDALVSNTECVVYNNRYDADYNFWGSNSRLIIYRRARMVRRRFANHHGPGNGARYQCGYSQFLWFHDCRGLRLELQHRRVHGYYLDEEHDR